MRREHFHALISAERRSVGASFVRAGLRAVSIPYALGSRCRNTLFDRQWKKSFRVDVPVLCVGNLTLGGTGKTPCVEYLAALVRDAYDRRPVILSRGYGADASRNDEAMVLEENLPDVPHLQGADRVAIARAAIEELEAEVLILDDGFQHRRLARDLDIVLLDATRPLQKEAMFPRGLLRESVTGLKRAGIAILTRCDQAADVGEQRHWLESRFPKLPVATSIHQAREWQCNGESVPLAEYTNRPVAAFCGLGNPQAFELTLAKLGYRPSEFRTFADHHNYTREDVDGLRRWAETLPADAVVLTTQKDWVKLRIADLAGRPLAALRIGLTLLTGESELRSQVEGVLGDAPDREN